MTHPRHDETARPMAKQLPTTPTPTLLKSTSCPGNVVGWRSAPPTMLPGHGSTFLQLSRQHRPHLSFPYATTAITSHQVSQKGEITWVVFDHLRVSYSLRLPSNSVSSGTNKGNPPIPQESIQKTQKRRWRRQVALRHFLAMAMIRCDYAPAFDGAHPQGVQWDSLEGL